MRRAIRQAALLAGAAAMLAPPAVSAQVRDLDREQSDVRIFQGNVQGEPAFFELTVPANSALRIEAITTSELDPMLRVLDARSGELIAEDDDGAGELNARVTLYGEPRARRVRIAVDGFDSEFFEEGETYGGTFDLRVASGDYRPAGTRAITYGAREIGTIEGAEHLFTIAGRAGQTVQIALVSQGGELDPFLELRDAAGEVLASDDDGGQEVNALLSHTFDAEGTYTIAASGYGETTGDYTLRVREGALPAAQLPVQVIGIADPASGELSGGFEEDGLEPATIAYQLSEEAKAAIRSGRGQVTIRMEAAAGADPDFDGELDPYLELGFDTPLGFAAVESDDDGAGELNALIPVDLSSLTRTPDLLDALRIRAQSVNGSPGGYTLTISEGLEARVEPVYDEGLVPEE